MGRDEVRKILTEALESLYEDRIRPRVYMCGDG